MSAKSTNFRKKIILLLNMDYHILQYFNFCLVKLKPLKFSCVSRYVDNFENKHFKAAQAWNGMERGLEKKSVSEKIDCKNALNCKVTRI